MSQFPTVWVENTADSLLNLAINYCVHHPCAFCQVDEMGRYELREGLALPEEICEKILSVSKAELKKTELEQILHVFKDTSRTRLRRVDFSSSAITDHGLALLMCHKIVELNLSRCKKLTNQALLQVNMLSGSLQSLTVGSGVFIDRETFRKLYPSRRADGYPDVYQDHLLDRCMGLFHPSEPSSANFYDELDNSVMGALQLPHIHKLSIHSLGNTNEYSQFVTLINSIDNLLHLDLSKCEIEMSFFKEISVTHSKITSLILCDVEVVRNAIPAICTLKELKHLDISNTGEQLVYYGNPNKTLKDIVESLENLVSLDISGTNLAGGRTQEASPKEPSIEDESMATDIPGLASRVNRPLEFLGLLNTAYDACYRHHIPAKKIAGDATEEQILTAGQIYCAREPFIQKVLNDLFQIFRFSTCVNTKLALDVVMEAMRIHLKAKHIQVSGSASLFYIVKGDYKEFFNIKIRRKIIKILIDAMFSHYSDVTMLRNGCLTLIHFKIPEDVFFDYERLATLLLLIVGQEEQDEFVQRIGVYLLNSLACQVDGIEKKLVGDRGAITIMLQVIERRLLRNTCDEVMETAWSTMWNVTDETPINCARFLENKGMDLFLGCLDAFPQKPELLRNMMGLLGNVAEVKGLRSFLMKEEYLHVFSKLLHSKSDGIEVSYNAAGILSHIASDGPEPWATHNITTVKREDVLKQMVVAIEGWNLDTKRNINYRSFKPILRLLTVDHTPEAQHWAVWALTNLTTVYPEKYCNLLKEEGGIDLLQAILENPNSNPRVLELATTTVFNTFRYENSMSDEPFQDDDVSDDVIDIT